MENYNVFEVGGIYRETSSNRLIRITKRTAHRVWFEFPTYTGKTVQADPEIYGAFKTVHYDSYADGELFSDSDLCTSYYAKNYVSEEEYQQMVKDYLDTQDRQEAKFEKRINDEADKMEQWLKSIGMTLEQAGSIAECFFSFSCNARNRVAERRGN